jgi:acetylornithine deacetylase/succinyl-diaminopimelate desuccinylase-like protein
LDLLGEVLAAVRDLDETQGSDPVLGRSSAVATMVDVRPESRNVIPDEVIVTVDWRILPGDTETSLLERLGEAVSRRLPSPPEGLSCQVRLAAVNQITYTGLERSRNMYSPGFLMDPEDPFVVAAAAAVGQRNEPHHPAAVRPWLFATDGGWSRGVHGIPTVGFAPGEERYAHTNRERLDVEEARWSFERYPHLIEALQATAVG